MYIGKAFGKIMVTNLSTVQESDDSGKLPVLVSCCFFEQGSVAPAREEVIEESVCKVC